MTQTFENLFLRKAVPADTTCIMQMITDAKKQMQREGKQQWQGAYPALSDITTDITSKQGYVLCDGYTAVAYSELSDMFEKSHQLEEEIRKQLESIGFKI